MMQNHLVRIMHHIGADTLGKIDKIYISMFIISILWLRLA